MSDRTTITISQSTREQIAAAKPYQSISADELVSVLLDGVNGYEIGCPHCGETVETTIEAGGRGLEVELRCPDD